MIAQAPQQHQPQQGANDCHEEVERLHVADHQAQRGRADVQPVRLARACVAHNADDCHQLKHHAIHIVADEAADVKEHRRNRQVEGSHQGGAATQLAPDQVRQPHQRGTEQRHAQPRRKVVIAEQKIHQRDDMIQKRAVQQRIVDKALAGVDLPRIRGVERFVVVQRAVAQAPQANQQRKDQQPGVGKLFVGWGKTRPLRGSRRGRCAQRRGWWGQFSNRHGDW